MTLEQAIFLAVGMLLGAAITAGVIFLSLARKAEPRAEDEEGPDSGGLPPGLL